MPLVFKWGLKWEPGRYFREQQGPEGRSSRSPRCAITVRLDENGDMENMIVCVSWWGRHKENAAQMIYAGEPVRIVSEPVCAAKLAAVVGRAYFSPVYTRGEGVRMCLWYQRTGERHWSCAAQGNSFEWTSATSTESFYFFWNTINSNHPASVSTILNFSSCLSFWACVHF